MICRPLDSGKEIARRGSTRWRRSSEYYSAYDGYTIGRFGFWIAFEIFMRLVYLCSIVLMLAACRRPASSRLRCLNERYGEVFTRKSVVELDLPFISAVAQR